VIIRAQGTMVTPVRLLVVDNSSSGFRASQVREVVREIHNLFWRIGEIRRRGLDRVGMQIDPCPEIPLPHEQRESVLACCIQDTHNLCKSRPVTSPIEVELFVRGWEAWCRVVVPHESPKYKK